MRDHSAPDDLVATNAHSIISTSGITDYRHFWISAYTERRVLVEGWAYIPPELVGLAPTDENSRGTGPAFWDQRRLALNDEVFSDPTQENVQELRTTYHVRWLFVDLSRKPAVRRLDGLADQKLTVGDFAIYELSG